MTISGHCNANLNKKRLCYSTNTALAEVSLKNMDIGPYSIKSGLKIDIWALFNQGWFKNKSHLHALSVVLLKETPDSLGTSLNRALGPCPFLFADLGRVH